LSSPSSAPVLAPPLPDALPISPQGYGAPNYPPQAYPQQPPYPGAPPGYPGQPGYPAYGPPGYPQQPGAYGPDPAYGAYAPQGQPDRKSTRLNSSHEWTSYAVFC